MPDGLYISAERKPKIMHARTVAYCHTCDRWFYANAGGENFDWHCTRCGAAVRMLRCTRCGYEWFPRGRGMPRVCSKCHSPYWNKERMLS